MTKPGYPKIDNFVNETIIKKSGLDEKDIAIIFDFGDDIDNN